MSFQENLRNLREKTGMSAKDMASKLNINYTTYANYENQGREPKYDLLCKIAAVLHVSIDDLLGYSAPSEHLRLLSIARACGLVISEQDGLLSVSLSDEAKAGLSEAELKKADTVKPPPLPQDLFDSAMKTTEKILLQRNKEQATLIALTELEDMKYLGDSKEIVESNEGRWCVYFGFI